MILGAFVGIFIIVEGISWLSKKHKFRKKQKPSLKAMLDDDDNDRKL